MRCVRASMLACALLTAGCTLPFSDPPSAPSNPTARVQGTLTLPERLDAERFARGHVELLDGVVVTRTARVDEAGAWLITEVVAGEYRVRAVVPGALAVESGAFALADGAEHDVGPLALVVDANAALHGTARLEGAAEHAGITVATEGFSATTDAEGRWRLAVTDGAHTLRFSKTGYAPATDEVRVDAGGEAEAGVDLVLAAEPGALRGAVQLPEGFGRERLPDVRVTLTRSADAAEVDAVAADSEGVFVFRDVAPETYDVHAALDGATPATLRGWRVEPGAEVNVGALQLRNDGAAEALLVRGSVLVANAAEGGHGGTVVEFQGTPFTATTQGDGGWAAEIPIRAEPYPLVARRDGYDPATIPAVTVAESALVDDPAEPFIDAGQVSLDALPARIDGLVSLAEAPAGDPAELLREVQVRVTPLDVEAAIPDPQVGNDGRFTVTDLPAGRYLLEVTLQGYLPAGDRLTLAPGDAAAVGPYVMSPQLDGRLVRGVARRQCLNAPCDHSGIRVEAVDTPFSTTTGSDGSYLLEVNERNHDLRFSLTGYAHPGVTDVDLRGEQLVVVPDQTLTLLPTRVVGSVERLDVESAPRPADGASVTLRDADGQAAAAERSNADGEFVIEATVEQGTYAVELVLDGHETLRVPVDVVPGRLVDLGARTLDLIRGALVGRVDRPEGDGVVTVVATPVPFDGARATVATEPPDDTFRLDRLPVGTWSVTAVAPGLRPPEPLEVVVEADAETEVALALTPRQHTLEVAPSAWTAAETVQVSFAADADLVFAQVWVDDAEPPPLAAVAGAVELALPAEDGALWVRARVANAAHANDDPGDDLLAYRSPVLSLPVVRDTEPPTVDALTSAAGTYTNDRLLDVLVSCDDALAGLDALVLRLRVDGALAYEGVFRARHTLQLPDADGAHSIEAVCADPAGNDSDPRTVEVVLDRVAPQLEALTVNGGEAATNDPRLLLAWAISDALSPVQAGAFDSPNVDCAVEALELPATHETVLQVQGEDGEHRLYVCARDRAGNAANPFATEVVTLDRVAPAAPRLQLRDPDDDADQPPSGWSNDHTVQVSVSGPAGVTLLLDGDLADGPTERAPDDAALESLTLEAGDGPRTVTAVARDAAGNVSLPYSAEIQVDTEAPAEMNVSLADGAAEVNTRIIAVTSAKDDALSALDLPDLMRLWEPEDGACAGDPLAADFARFNRSASFTLSGGDPGPRTVCVQFCDFARNCLEPLRGELELDTFVPRPRPEICAVGPNPLRAGRTQTVVFGADLQPDTVVAIGDLSFECALPEEGGQTCADARAAAFVPQAGGVRPVGPDHFDACDALEAGGGAVSCCTVTLDDAVARRAGSYVTRLFTPDPVEDGVGASAGFELLEVVAYSPVIREVNPRGIAAPDGEVADDQPPIRVTVFACGVADNYEARIGGIVGEPACVGEGDAQRCGLITEDFDDPRCADGPVQRPTQRIELEFDLAGVAAPEDDVAFVELVNPTPGGGAALYPFGINNEPGLCSLPCVSDLRATRPPLDDAGTQHALRVPTLVGWGGLSWRGGTGFSVSTLDDDAESPIEVPAMRVEGRGPRLLPPAMFKRSAGRVEDALGRGEHVVIAEVPRRGNDGFLRSPDYGALELLGPRDLLVADFDGDGHPDVVVADHAAEQLVTLLNTGEGVLVPVANTPSQGQPLRMHAADVNGDGALDLVVRAQEDDRLTVALNVGDGAFLGFQYRTDLGQAPGEGQLPARTEFDAIALGDTDHDRVPDLVFVTTEILQQPGEPPQQRVRLRVAQGEGNGDFELDGRAVDVAARRAALMLDDLDGDQRLDVVLVGLTEPYVEVCAGEGTGRFDPPAAVAAPEALTAARLEDVDGDGALDLLAVALSAPRVYLFRGTGAPAADGPFEPPVELWMHPTVDEATYDDLVRGVERLNPDRDVDVVDVDGDGRLNLLYAGRRSDFGRVADDTWSWRPANPNAPGGFAAPERIAERPAVRFDVEDLDGDGAFDVVGFEHGELRVHRGRPALRLGRFAELALEEVDANAPTRRETIAVGDLDNDGDLDMVIRHELVGPNDQPGKLSLIYPQGEPDGDYSLQARTVLTTGDRGFHGVELTDLDGDDRLDVVTVSGRDVEYWINEGARFPADAETVLLDGTIQDFAVADLDGGGRDDVVATVSRPGGEVCTRWIRNDSRPGSARLVVVDGACIRPADTCGRDGDESCGPVRMTVVDVTGDDVPDIVLANAGGVFRIDTRNGAIGQEAAPVALPGERPPSVQSVRLTRLGGRPDAVDLVVVGPQVVIRVDDIFDPQPGEPVVLAGSFANGFEVADLNLDGLPDLVLRESVDNRVLVYFGEARGFAGPMKLQYGTNTQSVAVGDFDANGVPDIVAPQSDRRVGVHLSPNPQDWALALRDPGPIVPVSDDAPVPESSGVYQPRQFVRDARVRFRLEGDDVARVQGVMLEVDVETEQAGRLIRVTRAVRLPRGDVRAGRDAGNFSSPPALQGFYGPGDELAPGDRFADLLDRWHPAGAWRLRVEPADAQVRVQDFTVFTRGSMIGE